MKQHLAIVPLILGCLGAGTALDHGERAHTVPSRASTEGPRFTSITAGDGFTCGLAADGTAWCWGANQYGQLGSRAASSRCKVDFFADGPCSLVPVLVDGGHRFTAIDAGSTHVCALDPDGAAYCWGKNIVGELGVEKTPEQCRIEFYAQHEGKDYEPEPCAHSPVAVATTLRFTAISAGNYFTCALARDRKAYCWGSRRDGRVGAGNRTDRHPEVVAVDATARFTQISADGSLACGLAVAGDVYCWGGHRSVSPTRVVAPMHFTHVSRGWGHTCALTADGHAYCWGSNDAGELGQGNKSSFAGDSVPAVVSVPEPLTSIDAGFLSTCATTRSGALYCWGDGAVLGAASPDQCFHVDEYNACALKPVRVALDHVSRVIGGFAHRCALTASGDLFCWGSNTAGGFGDGTRRSSREPVRVRAQAD